MEVDVKPNSVTLDGDWFRERSPAQQEMDIEQQIESEEEGDADYEHTNGNIREWHLEGARPIILPRPEFSLERAI